MEENAFRIKVGLQVVFRTHRNKFFLFNFEFFYFILCVWVFCMHECLYAICMQCWQRLATRNLQILWNMNYRQLWVAMLVLGTKSKSSSRATCTQPLIYLFDPQRRFLSTLCLDNIFLSSQWNSFIEIHKKYKFLEQGL